MNALVVRLIEEHMASGHYRSEDDLLVDALAALDARQIELAAIQEGIEDMEAGRVQPLDTIVDSIRAKHAFSADT